MYALADNPFFRPLPGLGATSTAPESTQIETSVATTLFTIAPATGLAAPFVLAAGAIAAALAAAGVGAGCGQTCIQATSLVNQAEPALLQHIQNYFAQPAPRSSASQATALSTFDQIWSSIETACSAIPGSAGKNCVSDRQAGSCAYKQTTDSPLLSFPGEPQAGACWNWFSGYRDPIANDPDVSDSVGSDVTSDVGSALTSVGLSSSYAVPLLIGAAVLAAWVVLK